MRLIILFFSFLLSSCIHPESFENKSRIQDLSFKVIGIKDGDTIDLLIDGTKKTIRLANIDAPEKSQPFGNKAKYFLSDLCFGKNVTLIHNDKFDRYRRLIAEIITDNGININKEMVSNGLAWHFKKYSSDPDYSRLENVAKEKKMGLWVDKKPIAPWIWRKYSKVQKKEVIDTEY